MKLPTHAAIALTLGAVAAFITARWMGVVQSRNEVSGPTVVIAARAIDAGAAIGEHQLKVVPWPASTVPEGAITRTADVAGRIARVPMIAGEPVLPGKLAPTNASGGLSSIIPDGKRAITVKVNEVIAVAGFALPGSYVDILVSGRDAEGQPFSRTVLSRIKVLAVAQETTAEPDKPKVVNAVTLELTPHESETLDLARSIGVLSLVLRNEFDTLEINSPGVRLADIIHAQPTGPAADSGTAQAEVSLQRRGPEEIRGTSRQAAATP